MAPAVGDGSCGDPIDLGEIPSWPYSSTTIGAPYTATVVPGSNGAPSLVFTYLLQPGYTITLRQDTNNYDSRHALRYGGSCPGSTAAVEVVDDPDEKPVMWTNRGGAAVPVFYIQSGHSGNSGAFTLSWATGGAPSCRELFLVTRFSATCLPCADQPHASPTPYHT